jgi:hypothetical protein
MHNMLDAESTIGQTFDLRGPESLSVGEILAILKGARYEEAQGWSIPQPLLKVIERYVIHTDLFTRRQLTEPPRDPAHLGFDYFDIVPDRLEDRVSHYQREYRDDVNMSRPSACALRQTCRGC